MSQHVNHRNDRLSRAETLLLGTSLMALVLVIVGIVV